MIFGQNNSYYQLPLTFQLTHIRQLEVRTNFILLKLIEKNDLIIFFNYCFALCTSNYWILKIYRTQKFIWFHLQIVRSAKIYVGIIYKPFPFHFLTVFEFTVLYFESNFIRIGLDLHFSIFYERLKSWKYFKEDWKIGNIACNFSEKVSILQFSIFWKVANILWKICNVVKNCQFCVVRTIYKSKFATTKLL